MPSIAAVSNSTYTWTPASIAYVPSELTIDCQGYALGVHNVNDKYIPKKIIYNGPATIVFWKDGTKTVVKCHEGTENNHYNAFCAALAKKILGNNSKVNRIVKSGIEN